MKKLFRALILLMPFVLFSCFEFVGGANTSKRMLNLALTAPGDVAKLHIGVFNSAISTETMLYNQTVAAGSSIPLDLPVGANRIILVWAEGYDGFANYYGSIGPVTIEENGDTPLPIQMNRFSNNITSFDFSWNEKDGYFIWNTIPGAFSYELELVVRGAVTDIISTGSRYDEWGFFDSYSIRVLTSVFGIGSVKVIGRKIG